MPNSQNINLPYHRKKQVYELFKNELNNSNVIKDELKETSYQYFNKIWRKNCENIKLRKWNKFTQCNECLELNNKICKTFNSIEKLEYSNKLKEHINLIFKERSSYKNKSLSKNKINL